MVAALADELDAAGLAPSPTLIKALRNKGFLKLMEKCAKAMRAHKKNLRKMERAMRSV